MSKKEKDVELIPDPPSGWKVKHGSNVGSNPSNYPKVDFAANSGPHLVIFKLQDVDYNSTKITPTFDLADPMWIAKGNTSPTKPGMDPQIADWAVFDNGKTLVILNTNSAPGDLSYRVQAKGYTPVLDPIIRNGGTTTPPSMETSYLLIAGVALLAFALGMFVHRQFFATK